jgi:two-component system chemotaxis response regulator CheV
MANDGILLESGTNEVEILEFILGNQSFGVNVLKIQAIEQHDPARVTKVQLAHPSVVGTLLFRDNCITMIDLGKELGFACDEAADDGAAAAVDEVLGDGTQRQLTERGGQNKLVLVMEFNQLKTSFLVDGVNRIHRVSWESFSPLSSYLSTTDSKFTGSLAIENREILIVDMEKIVTEILPRGQFEFSVQPAEDTPENRVRAERQVFLAEDSAVIRERVVQELAKGNYVKVRSFPNGRACIDEIARLSRQAAAEERPVTDLLAAVISDIEMPAMDGLAMCREIKETLHLDDVPVIMFSSLINDQIARKCDAVGANAYISKPQFTQLVDLLDEHCERVAAHA